MVDVVVEMDDIRGIEMARDKLTRGRIAFSGDGA